MTAFVDPFSLINSTVSVTFSQVREPETVREFRTALLSVTSHPTAARECIGQRQRSITKCHRPDSVVGQGSFLISVGEAVLDVVAHRQQGFVQARAEVLHRLRPRNATRRDSVKRKRSKENPFQVENKSTRKTTWLLKTGSNSEEIANLQNWVKLANICRNYLAKGSQLTKRRQN